MRHQINDDEQDRRERDQAETARIEKAERRARDVVGRSFVQAANQNPDGLPALYLGVENWQRGLLEDASKLQRAKFNLRASGKAAVPMYATLLEGLKDARGNSRAERVARRYLVGNRRPARGSEDDSRLNLAFNMVRQAGALRRAGSGLDIAEHVKSQIEIDYRQRGRNLGEELENYKSGETSAPITIEGEVVE
jgi:hypothetical protein